LIFKTKLAQHATSSYDLIIFGLLSKHDTPTGIDLLNDFFRLLRPNAYLITHIEHIKQAQAIDHFKMCGFDSCNPLDFNSSFLIDNKDDDAKKLGSLWLCQKPSFDIGYSVPLRTSGVRLMRQISSTTGGVGKKTWTVENDDLMDNDDSLDEDDRIKPDVKSKSEPMRVRIYNDTNNLSNFRLCRRYNDVRCLIEMRRFLILLCDY
jgi:hypothetical protein